MKIDLNKSGGNFSSVNTFLPKPTILLLDLSVLSVKNHKRKKVPRHNFWSTNLTSLSSSLTMAKGKRGYLLLLPLLSSLSLQPRRRPCLPLQPCCYNRHCHGRCLCHYHCCRLHLLIVACPRSFSCCLPPP
jgi:hypothetical protein